LLSRARALARSLARSLSRRIAPLRKHERVIELLPLRALATSIYLLARAASPSEVDVWLFSRFFPANNCDSARPGRKRRQRRRP
jgi:hypothetical protein